ncbi:MAG: hypothetical protein Q8K32_14520 [Archangium sp.]|nr:hypothetical protein [Archangium sp.]
MGEFGRVVMGVVMLSLGAACPRIEPARITADPASGECERALCGGEVAVKTSLAVGTQLTRAECESACEARWCGLAPIVPGPGCQLLGPETLRCDAVAYDCGYSFGSVCNASNCAGCCRGGDGTCDLSPAALVCGGESCLTCRQDAGARDPRCSREGCLALRECGSGLAGEPRPNACLQDAGIPPGFDALRYCPAACDASDAGALLACASSLGAQCADAGASECSTVGDAGVDLACLDGCEDTRRLCDERCPSSLTTFDQCMDCSARCGLEWVQCAKTCGR